MSQDLYVYSLDLQRLKSLQGCGDSQFLNDLLKREQARIQRHDDYFRQVLRMENLFPLPEALKQIFYNQIDERAVPLFQFEHAVVLLARSIGKPLGSDSLLDVNSDLWDEVDKAIGIKSSQAGFAPSDLPTLGEILQRGPLLNVPIDPDLPLGAGYLWPDECVEYLRVFKHVDLEGEKGIEELTWPDDALEILQEYRSWLNSAHQFGSGLFFHR